MRGGPGETGAGGRPERGRPGRGRLWLLLALLLFSTGAALTALYQKPDPPPPRVTLPRGMDRSARERMEARRTLPALPAAATGDDAPRPAAAARDPLMAALPASAKRAVLVIEANALRYSPVGEMLLACLAGDGGYQKMKKESGLDPAKDIDRISYADGNILVSGFFGDAHWKDVFPNGSPENLGADTVLWNGRGDNGGLPVAVWKNQMMVVGRDRAGIQEVVDRLEGRGEPAPPLLAENESYGEIYGVIAPALLTEMLAGGQPELAERLQSAASDVRLHVDASHDVGIVADITGKDPREAQDLAKALGAAMVLGRLRAKASGDDNLASALDFAAVRPGDDGSFSVEAGLPIALFERALGDCAKRKPAAAPAP